MDNPIIDSKSQQGSSIASENQRTDGNMDYSALPPKVLEASNAVCCESVILPEGEETVRGYEFNAGIDYDKLLQSLRYTGFQASHLGKAIEEINRMIKVRNVPAENGGTLPDDITPPKKGCTIFLAYTSNMVSCGVREIIRFLVENKQVDCLVSSCGGIEEDIMKCLAPCYHGEFAMDGQVLRKQGLNRIGNLIVPNKSYCLLEDFLVPILDVMVDEQREKGTKWTPSKFISRLGKEINDPSSIYYWCYKNDIPVFCPGITDGAIGDNFYFHSYKKPGLIMDVVEDVRAINNMAVYAKESGMIILGGGVVKHHTCNANLMRNGAEYAVYINTGQEFDGSDAGATPEEAKSWGKIKSTATPVKVVGDASILFPLVVAQTFAKNVHKK